LTGPWLLGWFVRNLVAFVRIMGVMERNTLAPLVDKLLSESPSTTTMIDITQSPLTIAANAAKTGLDDVVKGRAQELLRQYEPLGSDYWAQFVSDTSLVKTTLGAVGAERAARVMRHGFLNAMTAFHIQFGSAGLDQAPDERDFISFADAALESASTKSKRKATTAG
jgi:hypothetical protein